MKDVEDFQQQLEHPVPSSVEWFTGGPVVTEYELEQDGQAFVAFAGMFGVSPPRASSDVTSSPSA